MAVLILSGTLQQLQAQKYKSLNESLQEFSIETM